MNIKHLAITFFIVFIVTSNASAHDIDNLTLQSNNQPVQQNVEVQNRINVNEPLHCADGVCEGQPTNRCLANPQLHTNGRTVKQMLKNFWHWRRQLVAREIIFAGDVNALAELARSKGDYRGQPFMNYDPFFNQRDSSHPDIYNYYQALPASRGYGPIVNDGLEVRYDHFWLAHNLNVSGNTLLEFKTCGELQGHESFHSPDCIGAPSNKLTLVGGDSYKAPEPWRNEDLFIYYDRIPANPIGDACIRWLEGQVPFNYVLQIAAAHEDAGKFHVLLVEKRRRYIHLVLQKYRAM